MTLLTQETFFFHLLEAFLVLLSIDTKVMRAKLYLRIEYFCVPCFLQVSWKTLWEKIKFQLNLLKVEAYFLISALRFSKKKLEASFDANTLKLLQFCLHLMVEVFSNQRTEEVRRKTKSFKGHSKDTFNKSSSYDSHFCYSIYPKESFIFKK